MNHLSNQCVTERSWQCLQTEDEQETVERKKRIEEEENRKIREDDMRIECFIETCVDANASNLIALKANEVVALKYDVMRVCMKSQLFLSKIFEESERIWCRCKSNEFDFSTNMR